MGPQRWGEWFNTQRWRNETTRPGDGDLRSCREWQIAQQGCCSDLKDTAKTLKPRHSELSETSMQLRYSAETLLWDTVERRKTSYKLPLPQIKPVSWSVFILPWFDLQYSDICPHRYWSCCNTTEENDSILCLSVSRCCTSSVKSSCVVLVIWNMVKNMNKLHFDISTWIICLPCLPSLTTFTWSYNKNSLICWSFAYYSSQ